MPPVRADHGLSWRKATPHAVVSAAGGDGDEVRAKQPRRSAGGVPKRHSPSHSRTPSPNQQAPSTSGMTTVHAATHGHMFAHGGVRRSPSSKAGNAGSNSRNAFADSVGGPREKRRASPDPSRKGYAHAHSQRSLGSKSPALGPSFKGPSARSAGNNTWGVSSPTAGVGSGRANSSPTPPSGNGRGHCSPTLCRGVDAADAQGSGVPGLVLGGHSSASPVLPISGGSSSGGAGGGSLLTTPALEEREMTPLDRVFLEQPHEGRKDVEGDDLHLCNEIQRHLQSRVQSQQSQLIEAATNRNSSSSGIGGSGGIGGGGSGIGGGIGGGAIGRGQSSAIGGSSARTRASFGVSHQPLSDGFVGQEMELINDDGSCYSPDPVHDDPGMSDPGSFVAAQSSSRRNGGGTQQQGGGPGGYASPVSVPVVGGTDLMGNPDLGSAGVPPVSPSSGGGPAQGLVLDVGVGGPMDYLLDGSSDGRGGPREIRGGGGGCRSPKGSTLPPDVQMGDAGDGRLGEVVSGLDAMDLDDVDRALALLTAQKERIIAKKQAQAVLVPPQPPPQSASNGGGSSSSRVASGSGRHKRSSGRSRHSGEGSPSAGGRSEAFGVSGGGVRGAPLSFPRVPRGQGRPPPVPGHLSASTAAMRRSSPGSIASLAELDSYLEHHHRRLVEQVEGGVGVADDVEAEIKASRHPRRGTRSHNRFGASSGSNGLGSSSSSSGVPRTVGARVSTGSFFHSTLSADGDAQGSHRVGWNGKDARSGPRGWDPSQRGQGYKRERGELRGGGADGGWGAGGFRGFRGDGCERDAGGGSAFLGVSATTHSQTSSPPPSIMSSDDVSVSSYGHPVTVLPGSPNNLTFAGRPPPSLARIRLEAVRSPVVRHGRADRGLGGVEDGPVFTSPDASKHVQELCSPRSAFTPRSASSVSSLASSPARRR